MRHTAVVLAQGLLQDLPIGTVQQAYADEGLRKFGRWVHDMRFDDETAELDTGSW